MATYGPEQSANIGMKVKKAGAGMTRIGLNAAGSIVDAGMEFYNRRHFHPEESYAKSSLYAARNFAAWMLMPGVMWGVTLGEAGKELGKAAAEFGASAPSARAARWSSGGQIGMGFQDSDKAYTARQRGLQAIENSRLNARSALGNEARSLHQR